ncbi:MAG TPA: pantoate--beta-alanine ligase [Fimbriimonadaceae bacterium]|nr:pantoate--beta-alanine ligase [Fimbriimonadaceae bacterium]
MIRTVAEMATLGGGDLGFVPTMGAFHEGHLSLMREARKGHEKVVVSLFVNPLQFGQGEDYERYPRDEERDFALAEAEGVDYLFAPAREEIYRRKTTTICVPEVSEPWEGKARPGHFVGVATVVAKLFNIVRPEVAYFGWKDLQQCLVLRRMVEDLNMSVALRFMETLREPDGLALSSRNAYLSPGERELAPELHRTLVRIAAELDKNSDKAQELTAKGREELFLKGFQVEYLELVSLVDLQPTTGVGDAALIVASKIGTTRLIDNLRFGALTG